MDEMLVRKAQKGDKESFTAAVLQIKDQAYSIAYSYLHNEQDSLDAVYDAVEKVKSSPPARLPDLSQGMPEGFMLATRDFDGSVSHFGSLCCSDGTDDNNNYRVARIAVLKKQDKYEVFMTSDVYRMDVQSNTLLVLDKK